MWEHMPMVTTATLGKECVLTDHHEYDPWDISHVSALTIKDIDKLDYWPLLADFWSTHYHVTGDYRHKLHVEHLKRRFPDDAVLFLYNDLSGNLLGTVIGSPQCWSVMGRSLRLTLVDWLCVHSEHRSHAMARTLIHSLGRFFQEQRGIVCHAFHREVHSVRGPPPLMTSSYNFAALRPELQPPKNQATPQYSLLNKKWKVYNALWPRILACQSRCAYGRMFRTKMEFVEWLQAPCRAVLVSWTDAHVSILQDDGIQTNTGHKCLEVVWTSGTPAADAVAWFAALGGSRIGVFWGSHVASRPFIEDSSGTTVVETFSCNSYVYMFNYAYSPQTDPRRIFMMTT